MRRILVVVLLLIGLTLLQTGEQAFAAGKMSIEFEKNGPVSASIAASAIQPKIIVADITVSPGKHPEVEECSKYLLEQNNVAGMIVPVTLLSPGVVTAVVKIDDKVVASQTKTFKSSGDYNMLLISKSGATFAGTPGVHSVNVELTFTPKTLLSSEARGKKYKGSASCKYVVLKRK